MQETKSEYFWTKQRARSKRILTDRNRLGGGIFCDDESISIIRICSLHIRSFGNRSDGRKRCGTRSAGKLHQSSRDWRPGICEKGVSYRGEHDMDTRGQVFE